MKETPTYSDIALIYMSVSAWLRSFIRRIFECFDAGYETIDGENAIVLERDVPLSSGITGKLIIDQEEYNTLEVYTHRVALPDGVYVLNKNDDGVIYAKNGTHLFYITANRYHPKHGQIVIGSKYKKIETTNTKKTILIGGVPMMQEFNARFDLKLPVALIVTTKKEKKLGTE